MLHLDTTNEARALAYVAEQEGMDPEVAALSWSEATMAEAKAVVRLAQTRFGLSTEAEWAEDFLAAHRWVRTHGAAAMRRDLGLPCLCTAHQG